MYYYQGQTQFSVCSADYVVATICDGVNFSIQRIFQVKY